MDNFEQAKRQFLEGIALLEEREFDAAEGRFKRSLELLPGRVSTLTNLATAQIVLGKLRDARDNTDTALTIDPKSLEGWLNLGLVELQERHYQKAVQAFNKALTVNRQSLAGWKGLAKAHDAVGDSAESLRCYEEVLRLDANEFEALSNAGAILNDLKRFEEALGYHERALRLNPRHAQTLSNQGVALQGQRRLEEALAAHEQALASEPGSADAYFNKGLVYQELRQLEPALQAYSAAIRIHPESASAWSSKAVVLHQLGRLEEALQAHLKSLTLNPNSAESWSNKALTMHELGRLEEALADYAKALVLKPDFAQVYSHQALLFTDLQRPQSGLEACDRALALKSDYAEAWNNRGLALKALNRLDEALESFDRAISIKPDFAEAYSNLGLVLQAKGQYEAAIASCERAITLRPDLAAAYNNRGFALQAWGQVDAAIDSYEQAIARRPDYAEANSNLSVMLLLKEDWSRGWYLCEWGFKVKNGGRGHKKIFARDWDGLPLQGALLVLREQGIGDEIFYSGMLNDLKGYADTIAVCVDPRLVSLFQRSFDHINVVSPRELAAQPPHDAQVYMASLGQYFRKDGIGLKAVRTPYLKASAERAQGLRRRIAGEGKTICGLSWISKNQEVGEDKSLRLADLQPLLELPGVVFVDLQYGDTSAERAALLAATGVEVMRIPEIDNFNDIDGLAALMEACDVVVTVSNSTAHLAGALGKMLMIMLPLANGLIWYWHLGREDSPWYPGARLFRQSARGLWSDVINDVTNEIRTLTSKNK